MAIVLETTLGDLTIDLYITERPKACLNFLKLCKMKYYNFNLFHTIQHEFLAQTGDPTGAGTGGESIWGVTEGSLKRYFEGEEQPKIRHTNVGTVSLVSIGNNMLGSQFFITLAPNLVSLDTKHCVIGEVTEGLDILRKINEAICDEEHRPYQDIRITHTVILEDPYPDPDGFHEPSRSPEPTAERLQGGRIAADEEIDETIGKTTDELAEMAAEREAKARATILEMVGDIPDAEMAPPENVLFVCKLNPVTTDDDLEIIFSRFGKIKSCEVIRDKQSGDSLQYAFVEFEEQKSCEDAYFKMDNVLIDDRRIHVDFSQSVAKLKWLGKGRGVKHIKDEKGKNGKVYDDDRKKKYTDKEDRRNTGEKFERHRKNRNERYPAENDEYRNREHPRNYRNKNDWNRDRERQNSSNSRRYDRSKNESRYRDEWSHHDMRDDRRERRNDIYEKRTNTSSSYKERKYESRTKDRSNYKSSHSSEIKRDRSPHHIPERKEKKSTLTSRDSDRSDKRSVQKKTSSKKRKSLNSSNSDDSQSENRNRKKHVSKKSKKHRKRTEKCSTDESDSDSSTNAAIKKKSKKKKRDTSSSSDSSSSD